MNPVTINCKTNVNRLTLSMLPRNLEGRSVSPVADTSFPVISSVVPSIHDPHPTIRIEDLPSSLRSNLQGLKILEFMLIDYFYVQTHCNLIELVQLLPKQDFNTIITHFSIILGLIRTVNQHVKSEKDDVRTIALNLKKMLLIFLPGLNRKLLENWEEIQTQVLVSAKKMGSTKSDSVRKHVALISEAFKYLGSLIDSEDCGFSVLNTSLLHMDQPAQSQPAQSVRSMNEWLELMLRYTVATKQWFNMHPSFWREAGDPEDNKDYSDKLNLINRFIQKRLKLDTQSVKTLMQLRASINPYLTEIGNMFTRALGFLDDPMRKCLIDQIGFGIKPIQKLGKSIDWDPKMEPLFYFLIESCYPDVIRMGAKHIMIIDVMYCAAITDMQKMEGIEMDAEILRKMIEEGQEVADFLGKLEQSFSGWNIFFIGTRSFSYADMSVRINNIIKILNELTKSPEKYSSSILYSLFDLKGSICDILMQGVSCCLQSLNKTHEELQKTQAKGNEVDLQLVDLILDHIQCAVNMVEMLNEKSDSLNTLMNRLIEGEVPQQKTKTDKFAKKKPKGRKKKKTRPKTERSLVKEKNKITKDVEKRQTEIQLVAVISEEVTPSVFKEGIKEENDEKTVSIKDASQKLTKATENLQKSLAEVVNKDSLSDNDRKMRNVKWRKLCKELKEAGFVIKRSSGSHCQYQHPQAKDIGVATVPINSKNNLSIGVVKNVREQIQRSKENRRK